MCPTNHTCTRREIHSYLITENPIAGQDIKEPTCHFEIISNITILDNDRTNFTSPSDNIPENLKENATLKYGTKNNKLINYDEENKQNV